VAPDGGGAHCSDLNTTQFLRQVIEAERSDLIAFTSAVLSPPPPPQELHLLLLGAAVVVLQSLQPWLSS
jgi:hypothetical protein